MQKYRKQNEVQHHKFIQITCQGIYKVWKKDANSVSWFINQVYLVKSHWRIQWVTNVLRHFHNWAHFSVSYTINLPSACKYHPPPNQRCLFCSTEDDICIGITLNGGREGFHNVVEVIGRNRCTKGSLSRDVSTTFVGHCLKYIFSVVIFFTARIHF